MEKAINRRRFLQGVVLTGLGLVALKMKEPQRVLAASYRKPKDPTKKITQADRKAAAARTLAARQAAGITNVALATNGAGVMVPDYFGTTPNYANSPILTKFVDTLPLLGAANNLGQMISVAVPDTSKYPGSDYYEIELGQYTQQMHTELPPTTLRGYRQTNGGDGQFHYMGPVIIAQRDRPVRILFTNNLPTGAGGNLFIPCDPTYMGAGMGPNGGNYTQNRSVVHLHGGNTPWISDGTPHQWVTPAGEATPYTKGVSMMNVPDMPAPGPGQATYYYTNQQSARLMFYHDHAYGLTRLNVYAGVAAGYLVTEPIEQLLVNGGTYTVPNTNTTVNFVPTIPAEQIPLIIQDKTFVDPLNIATQDPTWLDPNQPTFGTTPGTAHGGDLWFPHVYMPNQNPFDITGTNACGRWDYGPWFWPPFTGLQFGPVTNPYASIPGEPPEIPGTPLPSGVPEGFMDTPIVNGTAYPRLTVEPKPYRFRILNACNDRNLNLQLYVATGIMDSLTLTSGGSGYTTNPNVTISGGGGYGATAQAVADLDPASATFGQVTAVNIMTVGSGFTSAPTVTIDPPASGTQATATATFYSNLTEVGMVPAVPGSWPAGWPTPDARDGGFPDPAQRGPNFVQIGNESGILPAPVVIPNRPVGYDYNRRSITVLNVLEQALFMGPAERADAIIDFTNFAGKTLIVYNDAPAPVPAFDPRLDYYTCDVNQVDTGGAPTTLAGKGPNTRTIMQIYVGTSVTQAEPALNMTTLSSALATVFGLTQEAPIVPQAAYNQAFGANYPTDAYVRIQDTSANVVNGSIALTLTSGGAGYTAAPAVSIGAPSAGGVQATAVANLAPVPLAGLTLTSGGANYTTAPAVSITGGGGTGATATAALAPSGVASVTITNRGSGYTSAPKVAFSAPPAPGTTATGTAVVSNRRVIAVTITSPGSGYTTAPTVTFSGGGGTGAAGTAALQPAAVGSLILTAPGSGFTSTPTVSFSGGGGSGAAATAAITPTVVASLTLTNAGVGYLVAPSVSIAAPQTTGSTATATASLGTINMKIKPKAIQELFTVDYGRMNATLGVEIPNTTGINQTTIPYGYIDPPTEIVTDSTGAIQIGAAPDGSQIWKITHNGVDTHTIHFHLFNVQVINRVGWDGMIKPPLPNEIGWKESVRMHPLEDCIVALRPRAQTLPFELPNSVRSMDVTMNPGSTMGFTNVDPTGQPANVTNTPINFGYEYVWHCHLLGHEENDMMRPIIFLVAPKQKPVLALPTYNKGIILTWSEASPNVTSFSIQRATGTSAGPTSAWTMIATVGKVNSLVFTYTDTTVKKNNTYWYRVIANNQVGYLQAYAAPAAGYPTDMVSSAPSDPQFLTI